jgi:hypothetical protein
MRLWIRALAGLALASLLSIGLAANASAAAPARSTQSQSVAFDIPAGFGCDFHLGVSSQTTYTTLRFPNGRGALHLQSRSVYVNLETGYTLFGKASATEALWRDGRSRVVGLAERLRDGRGRLVAVSAGQYIASYVLGFPQYLKVTPHMTPDWYVRICTALGGHSVGYP